MQISPGNSRNTLFHQLWRAPSEHATKQVKTVALETGTVLHEPGSQPRYCYFPTTAIVSMAYQMASGTATEVAAIGNEGMVGAGLLTYARVMPCFAVVQQSGAAIRLPVDCLRAEYERRAGLAHAFLDYALLLVEQISQNAACSRLHPLSARLPRWLLSTQDRCSNTPDLLMTHESLAHVLGVRREAISHAAMQLQQTGLIRYRRGHIRICDRAGLIERACECYVAPEIETRREPHGPCNNRPGVENLSVAMG